ncbi:hypothetical protein JOC77_002389 [Peribacillus deserti]|uniref:Uncharacterized protein n=1 Tax=Peribacillus deserti TaxID=673318 RepID=A0ABS2QIG3_9BACI|nr:hypothetical protein [Peribacillus deserti]
MKFARVNQDFTRGKSYFMGILLSPPAQPAPKQASTQSKKRKNSPQGEFHPYYSSIFP